jgi:plastocyanin
MRILRNILITGAALFALTLAACGGKANAGGNTLNMDASTFSGVSSLTVKVGQSVKFADAAGGATHFLTTGQNGAYASESGAPAQLSAATGMQIDPGQSDAITFATAGTYHITCTVHPGMNVTITVTN